MRRLETQRKPLRTRETVFEMIFTGNAIQVEPGVDKYLGFEAGRWISINKEQEMQEEITRVEALELIDRHVEVSNNFFTKFNVELEWALTILGPEEVDETQEA